MVCLSIKLYTNNTLYNDIKKIVFILSTNSGEFCSAVFNLEPIRNYLSVDDHTT